MELLVAFNADDIFLFIKMTRFYRVSSMKTAVLEAQCCRVVCQHVLLGCLQQ